MQFAASQMEIIFAYIDDLLWFLRLENGSKVVVATMVALASMFEGRKCLSLIIYFRIVFQIRMLARSLRCREFSPSYGREHAH